MHEKHQKKGHFAKLVVLLGLGQLFPKIGKDLPKKISSLPSGSKPKLAQFARGTIDVAEDIGTIRAIQVSVVGFLILAVILCIQHMRKPNDFFQLDDDVEKSFHYDDDTENNPKNSIISNTPNPNYVHFRFEGGGFPHSIPPDTRYEIKKYQTRSRWSGPVAILSPLGNNPNTGGQGSNPNTGGQGSNPNTGGQGSNQNSQSTNGASGQANMGGANWGSGGDLFGSDLWYIGYSSGGGYIAGPTINPPLPVPPLINGGKPIDAKSGVQQGK